MSADAPVDELKSLLDVDTDVAELVQLSDSATCGLKLSNVLPPELPYENAARRVTDPEALKLLLNKPIAVLRV